MNTAIINSDSYEKHNTGDGHPEQPKRVIAIKEKLKKRNDLIWETPVSVPDDILAMTHSKEYIENLNNSFPQKGLKFLDGDTVVSPESKKAVFDAAGSTIKAIDGIENNQFKNAFCLARPPGHHAEKNKAMGFCIYNNCAVAAHYLIEKYKYQRIAIFDPDVHHGNGTQDIFYNNKNVTYYSTHQYPLYPGTGDVDEVGCGNIFNIPLVSGTSSVSYQKIFQEKIIEQLEIQQPDFLIISAGFDAHKDDPLANINLSNEDFVILTKKLKIIADKYCNGKILSMLEGGYDISALENAMIGHISELQE